MMLIRWILAIAMTIAVASCGSESPPVPTGTASRDVIGYTKRSGRNVARIIHGDAKGGPTGARKSGPDPGGPPIPDGQPFWMNGRIVVVRDGQIETYRPVPAPTPKLDTSTTPESSPEP